MNVAAPDSAARIPTMSPALARNLPLAGIGATLAAALVMAALTQLLHRPDWWPAFLAASIVAVTGTGISVLILRKLAGKPVDVAVMFVMAASGIRMFVSMIGLLVAVSGVKTPTEPTGYMILGYYAAMLITETTLLFGATSALAEPSEKGTGVTNG